MNDSISDLFTRLRNASLAGHDKVHVPWTKMNERFIQILFQQGFILSYQSQKTQTLIITLKYRLKPRRGPVDALNMQNMQVGGSLQKARNFAEARSRGSRAPSITQIKRLSRPSCRIYIQSKQIPTLLRNSLGTPILFLSTSQGILSDREAYRLKLGGEILGFVS